MNPELAVFDIDGVLADVRHRLHFVATRPKDWDSFFDAAIYDGLLAPGFAAVQEQVRAGRTIVYVTGRPQGCRQDTVEWLERNGLPLGEVHMRALNDRRPAKLVKPELIRRLSRKGQVQVVYDDDVAVVQALRAHFPTLEVVAVDWMEPSSAQATLFDAQENEGRT